MINGEYNEDNLLDLEALVENNDYDQTHLFLNEQIEERYLALLIQFLMKDCSKKEKVEMLLIL